MSGPCTAVFEQLANELGGFGCHGANAVVNLHNPLDLSNWTLPVIELTMIVGSVLSFRHALQRRRDGDPSGLAIWVSAVVFLAVLEPPGYFPDVFGLDHRVGLVFVHNEFSVQFLWDRLPLYIVCLYPAMAYLAYELVRVLGVFERRGVIASAVCVGFVYQCFYEIFDHLGPQLRWWFWNPGADSNHPMLGSVPVSSMFLTGAMGPFALTLLVRTLVSRKVEADGSLSTAKLLRRSALVGALIPLFLIIGGIPASIAGLGDPPNHTAQAIAFSVEIALFGLTATTVIVSEWRHQHRATRPPEQSRYLVQHAAIYLTAMALLWVTALPAYLSADHGTTSDGTPIGSLPYAAACLVASAGFLALAGTRPRIRHQDRKPYEPLPV